ncbi:small-conductance mechanosensitive channel [Lewinella marina]|uniref:Mechanosensitive ion channel protein MscS n=1 Tax=Neolewinella marina TaxID=438751 RepID=A0A2G0CJE1_9BACT|nr:mechanosensitive ion channel [Neolewinella marina]NJB84756.1 small-conductance mechanosensitive channel [Neolewinella marina]PHL00085.1 mechanosensitive ion channel protein MscS [Neolewinella marina]
MEEEVRDLGTIFIEAWNNFLEAIPGIILALVIMIVGLFAARAIARFFGSRVLGRMDDPLMGRFLLTTLKVLIIIGAALLALRAAGLSGIATALFSALGASALILGFAFRDIGENFISGIILAFNRPFNINDTIRVVDHFGKVKSLQFRYTHIKTFDGKDVYIPNSDVLTQPVQNYTADGFIRYDFIVGIAYEDDIQGAKDVIQGVLDTHYRIIHDGEHISFVAEDALAASTVNLKVYFWLDTKDFRAGALQVRGEVIRDIKNAIDAAHYNLPADITEIRLYGSERDIPIRVEFDDTPNSEAENLAPPPSPNT